MRAYGTPAQADVLARHVAAAEAALRAETSINVGTI
jgi:hypothetical protein